MIFILTKLSTHIPRGPFIDGKEKRLALLVLTLLNVNATQKQVIMDANVGWCSGIFETTRTLSTIVTVDVYLFS